MGGHADPPEIAPWMDVSVGDLFERNVLDAAADRNPSKRLMLSQRAKAHGLPVVENQGNQTDDEAETENDGADDRPRLG